MPNYSYFYTKAIAGDDGNVKTVKFHTGNSALHGLPTDDIWSTSGKYRLTSRLLRGGLSGSGDVFHPANAIFKIIYQRPMTPRIYFIYHNVRHFGICARTHMVYYYCRHQINAADLNMHKTAGLSDHCTELWGLITQKNPRYYGVRGVPNMFFKDYFTKQSWAVKIDQIISGGAHGDLWGANTDTYNISVGSKVNYIFGPTLFLGLPY